MHRYGLPLILKGGQHPPERHRLLNFTISNARSNSVLNGGQHGPEYPPDNYVIIGGTACDIIIEDAGLTTRVTKDIDMILVVEASAGISLA